MTRPLDPAKQQFWMMHGALPLLLTVALYVWTQHTDFDLHTSQWLFTAGDGHFFDGWFLANVMHEGMQVVGYTFAGVLLAATLASFLWLRLKPARLALIFLVTCAALGSLSVAEVKRITNVYCPSELTIFGGDKPLHSPFDTDNWNPQKRGGQCWPGGHSSYGFSLWAIYFIAREHRRKWSIPALVGIAVYGNILGLTRVLQGAHFLSHQWWTASLCWFITVFFYVLLLRRDLLPSRKDMADKNILRQS